MNSPRGIGITYLERRFRQGVNRTVPVLGRHGVQWIVADADLAVLVGDEGLLAAIADHGCRVDVVEGLDDEDRVRLGLLEGSRAVRAGRRRLELDHRLRRVRNRSQVLASSEGVQIEVVEGLVVDLSYLTN